MSSPSPASLAVGLYPYRPMPLSALGVGRGLAVRLGIRTATAGTGPRSVSRCSSATAIGARFKDPGAMAGVARSITSSPWPRAGTTAWRTFGPYACLATAAVPPSRALKRAMRGERSATDPNERRRPRPHAEPRRRSPRAHLRVLDEWCRPPGGAADSGGNPQAGRRFEHLRRLRKPVHPARHGPSEEVVRKGNL